MISQGKRKKKLLPWLLTASLLFFSLSFQLLHLSTPTANDGGNIHSCSLTGRAFWKCSGTQDHARLEPLCWCQAAGVLLGIWIQLGLCSFCALLACCSLIRRRLSLKCFSYKKKNRKQNKTAVLTEVKGLSPTGAWWIHHFLLFHQCLHPWECNLIFALAQKGVACEMRAEDAHTSWSSCCLFQEKLRIKLSRTVVFFFHDHN